VHDFAVNTKASPALVAREAALELPRYALFAFCAAYVLPGLFGRDPWRGEDLAAFGQMLAIAEGRTSWFAPALGGVPADGALLPHWIGAASILLNGRWLDPALAARLPFVLLLVATLAAIWYATFHLARTDAAQPVRFAFGGEAGPVDYARAVADGALLAAIATIGLLQLGHETTPELAQLAAVAAFQWALAASERRPLAARWTVLLALPCLAASGAPTIALLLGALAVPWAMRDGADGARRLWPWLVGATLLGVIVATLLDAWAWRATLRLGPQQIIRLWLWFLWPSWLLAGWTLWRWRQHLGQRHLAVPLLSLAIALAASIVTGGSVGGSDRALMLGIPGIAVLAAFALPTLRRSASAAIDWFSVFFFTACALVIWVMYVAMQTGVPAKPAANIAKLAPGFEARLSIVEIVFATLGTLAWLWLVRWRTSHHRAALWKSLVLPAGGVALCWLLLMTLWLPLLDYARSYRALVDRLERVMPAGACIAAPHANPSLVAALEYHAKRAVDASPAAARGRCDILVVESPGTVRPVPPPGWKELAVARRPTERHELTLVYRRTAR
jgi:4-amino-4-deoxy-L-arabinose transferase-like glycosyltransferase